MFTSRKSTFLDIASNCKSSAMYMSFYSAAKFFIVVTLSLVVVNLSSFLLSSPLSNHCTGDRFIPFSSGQKQTVFLPHWSIYSVSKANFSVNLPVLAYEGSSFGVVIKLFVAIAPSPPQPVSWYTLLLDLLAQTHKLKSVYCVTIPHSYA